MANAPDPSKTVFQGSFAAGEMSPLLYSRVDLNRWASSLKTCRNFITQPHGGVKNRPGTRYIATVKFPDSKTRLIPFRFNSAQNYLIELGHKYMRFFEDGAPVISSVAEPWVTGHAYAVGARVVRNGVNYVCIVAHTSGAAADGVFTVTP